MATVVAMGTGSLEKHDAREVSYQWRRAIEPPRRGVKKGFDEAQLLRLGLAVKRVPVAKGSRRGK